MVNIIISLLKLKSQFWLRKLFHFYDFMYTCTCMYVTFIFCLNIHVYVCVNNNSERTWIGCVFLIICLLKYTQIYWKGRRKNRFVKVLQIFDKLRFKRIFTLALWYISSQLLEKKWEPPLKFMLHILFVF